LRKRRGEVVARLSRATEAEAQALRQSCGLACLTDITRIVSAYEEAPALLEREGIDDRAVDLWSPLVAVSRAADLEHDGRRTRELLDVARELGAAREADAEAGTTARLLNALDAVRAAQGETITPADLLRALRARPGWEWLASGRRLAGLLHPI